ncbi:MAG: beta-lactamase family protein [Chloroflexi bacterium]|nr:MAG: beta-lactamase family protein [Chloroflexota bacterium]
MTELVASVASVMKQALVPGLALGLVGPGENLLRGFGVTSLPNPLSVDTDTIFVAASITKTCVATTVMRLLDRGQLELDKPIRSYLPDLRLADESVAAAVTLRHLMTHTAGWVGDEFEASDFGLGDDALARAVATFGNRPQILPLGSQWSYNNSGFWLAGRVIEVVAGKSLEAAITEILFRPLGMNNSFFFEADAITRRCAVGHVVGENGEMVVARPWSTTRASHAAGGWLTTITDLMTYARFHLDDGRAADGSRVLSQAALHSMREPQFPGAGPESAGIGWVVRDVAGQRVLSHGGDWNGQQSLLTLVPGRGIAIATLANSGLARLANNDIAAWALRRYLGEADPEPIPNEEVDDRVEALVGRYVLPGASVEIVSRGPRLGINYRSKPLPGIYNPSVPELRAALTTDGRIVLLDGPFRGVTGEFSIGTGGIVEWVRIGGRIYPRESDPRKDPPHPGRSGDGAAS